MPTLRHLKGRSWPVFGRPWLGQEAVRRYGCENPLQLEHEERRRFWRWAKSEVKDVVKRISVEEVRIRMATRMLTSSLPAVQREAPEDLMALLLDFLDEVPRPSVPGRHVVKLDGGTTGTLETGSLNSKPQDPEPVDTLSLHTPTL